ncbi:MAG: hypothetical protein AB7H80_03575 [Candidatus Kapaibacterium sp.]
MPSSRTRNRKIAGVTILSIGLLCAVVNLFVTLNRSTIPRTIEATVVAKEIGYEKHPGRDDVCWLILDNGEKTHVDQAVWNRVSEGDQLSKKSWSRELMIGENLAQLQLSKDAEGMIPVMSGVFLLFLFLLMRVWKKGV